MTQNSVVAWDAKEDLIGNLLKVGVSIGAAARVEALLASAPRDVFTHTANSKPFDPSALGPEQTAVTADEYRFVTYAKDYRIAVFRHGEFSYWIEQYNAVLQLMHCAIDLEALLVVAGGQTPAKPEVLAVHNLAALLFAVRALKPSRAVSIAITHLEDALYRLSDLVDE